MNSSINLSVDGVSYAYPGSTRNAIDRVQCTFKTGEIIALIGHAAAGKSTFGKILKGLIEPSSGLISITRDELIQKNTTTSDRMKLVGWAGAHPETQLFASTVSEDIAFGPANQGCNPQLIDEKITTTMSAIGLDPEFYAERYPHFLSGGERRRVALAGIIAMDYPFYIFDEPTAGLDSPGRKALMKALNSLKERGKGIMVITHDMEFIKGSIGRLWGMRNGALVLDADTNFLETSSFNEVYEMTYNR